MTGSELDEILAESAAPETTEDQEQTTQETETNTQQPRDETGRFATKAETKDEPQEPVATAEDEPAESGKVPQQALHAARQKEKEAKNEAEQLRQQLAQMQGQFQLLSQRQAPQPQKTEDAPKPVDIWENPDGYLESKLSPIQQMMQQQREEFSKALAIQSHGKDTVDNAYKAFVEAAQANPGAYAGEYQSMMASANPYDALVDWHKRQQTLQTVGNDPNAWLEAEMEKRLSDPAYQAKVLERIKGAAAANTDRSNPVTQLPPSLNRLPAGGNVADDGDMSDAALFSHAMR